MSVHVHKNILLYYYMHNKLNFETYIIPVEWFINLVDIIQKV